MGCTGLMGSTLTYFCSMRVAVGNSARGFLHRGKRRSRSGTRLASLARLVFLIRQLPSPIDSFSHHRDDRTFATFRRAKSNPISLPISDTELGAFWSRGNGAKDDTSGIETTQANNGRWRRRSRDGQASEAVDERRRSRRNRPTGALRVETSRGRRSTERYFYSASFVSTHCPSFPEETCEIDYGDDDEDHSSDANSGHWVKNPGRIVEGALTNFVHRHAIHTLNLRISSRSLNTTGAFPLLLRGDVGELDVSFDRLAFPSLKLSGGGTIRALGLTVNPCSFLPVTGRFARRFRDPFELQALGCVFTQEDIRNSSLLRDGLGMLLERIVKRLVAASNDLLEAAVAGVDDYVSVKVLEVDILVSRREVEMNIYVSVF